MVSPQKTGGTRITNIEPPPADDYMYVALSVFLIWQSGVFYYDSLYFLFGSHAYLSAVAQTRPYGLRHGLDADS